MADPRYNFHLMQPLCIKLYKCFFISEQNSIQIITLSYLQIKRMKEQYIYCDFMWSV